MHDALARMHTAHAPFARRRRDHRHFSPSRQRHVIGRKTKTGRPTSTPYDPTSTWNERREHLTRHSRRPKKAKRRRKKSTRQHQNKKNGHPFRLAWLKICSAQTNCPPRTRYQPAKPRPGGALGPETPGFPPATTGAAPAHNKKRDRREIINKGQLRNCSTAAQHTQAPQSPRKKIAD